MRNLMENQLNSNILRVKLILMLLFPLLGYSQKWEIQSSTTFNSNISAWSHDALDHLVIGTQNQELIKLKVDGTVVNQFSDPSLGEPTLIDVSNGLLPFCFYRDNQKFIYLDRFFSNPVIYNIREFIGGFVWLASPSVDRNIWMLQTSPLTLFKVNPLTKSVLQDTQLVLDFPLTDISHFLAYKNFIALVDRKEGIFLFDFFGNLLAKFPLKGVEGVQIVQQQIIAYSDGSLHSIDLNTRDKNMIPAPTGFLGVLNVEGRYFYRGKRSISNIAFID